MLLCLGIVATVSIFLLYGDCVAHVLRHGIPRAKSSTILVISVYPVSAFYCSSFQSSDNIKKILLNGRENILDFLIKQNLQHKFLCILACGHCYSHCVHLPARSASGRSDHSTSIYNSVVQFFLSAAGLQRR